MLIKPKKDILRLKKSGKILGKILFDLTLLCKPGVSTMEIDTIAEKMILEAGGIPAFKHYRTDKSDPPFPATICASLNNEIVHGIPSKDVILKNGDIFSIDIGMKYPGEDLKNGVRSVFTDTATTVIIGKIPKKTKDLLHVTKNSLEAAISIVKAGVPLAEIGRAVEDYVKSQGNYGIIRDLSGHGVGHAVHEDPWIPNFYVKELEDFILEEGMVLAIEPMVTTGGYKIRTASDKWTIETADQSLCAHFEHTLVVTKKGCTVVTRRPNEL